MNKPHIHADIIKAWADGKMIEIMSEGTWIDVFSIHPFWHPLMQYRIKPMPTLLKFRLCVRQQEGEEAYVLAVHDDDSEQIPPGFVRWISEWQEVEL